MKTHLYHKRLLHNQEIFETGSCQKFSDIPQIKSLIILTKNKKTNTEENLLLKLALLQLFFCRKAFILIGSKNSLTLKKFPIGGFLTLRENLIFFLDLFFHTTLKKIFHNLSTKVQPFHLKFIFNKRSKLIKHSFRYSLFLF